MGGLSASTSNEGFRGSWVRLPWLPSSSAAAPAQLRELGLPIPPYHLSTGERGALPYLLRLLGDLCPLMWALGWITDREGWLICYSFVANL